MERDIYDERVTRFGIKNWDVPVLKAGKRWPPSGRILLFTLENKNQKLIFELGLGWSPEGTDTREKLFRMALSNQPPFFPPKYGELPKQWVYLYRRLFLNSQDYTDLSDEELDTVIRTQWLHFIKEDFPKMDAIVRAELAKWQYRSQIK